MRLAASILLAATLLAACGPATDDGDGGRQAANLRLHVVAAPTCPVETMPPDPACAPRPLAGATLIVSGGDGTSETLVAGADGAAVGLLAAGRYTVTPQPVEGVLGTAAPFEITIESGGALFESDVVYDTGIR